MNVLLLEALHLHCYIRELVFSRDCWYQRNLGRISGTGIINDNYSLSSKTCKLKQRMGDRKVKPSVMNQSFGYANVRCLSQGLVYIVNGINISLPRTHTKQRPHRLSAVLMFNLFSKLIVFLPVLTS